MTKLVSSGRGSELYLKGTLPGGSQGDMPGGPRWVFRYRFGAQRESLNVRFAPRATELLCRREMTRRVTSGTRSAVRFDCGQEAFMQASRKSTARALTFAGDEGGAS